MTRCTLFFIEYNMEGMWEKRVRLSGALSSDVRHWLAGGGGLF